MVGGKSDLLKREILHETTKCDDCGKRYRAEYPVLQGIIRTSGDCQPAGVWKDVIHRELNPKNNMTELYFEEADIELFVKKLETSEFEIAYVNELTEHSWGRQVIRFYDPDGNLIEVGMSV